MKKRLRKKKAKRAREMKILRQEVVRLGETVEELERLLQVLQGAQKEGAEQGAAPVGSEEKDEIIRLLLEEIRNHESDYHHQTDPRLLDRAARVSRMKAYGCRGIADRLFSLGLCHQECFAPSRRRSQP